MPPKLTSDSILFAIHSAIRMDKVVQRAYVNSIKAKEIVLPLPAFNQDHTLLNASRFFENSSEEGGAQFLNEIEALNLLHQAHFSRSLDPEEEKTYIEYYVVLFRTLRNDGQNQDITGASLRKEDILALLKLRQWEKGKQNHPSALQLVAGTLVEIGIDYFNQTPGALHPNSKSAKILRKVLEGFDEIRFSESIDIKKTLSQEILPILFIGATESLQFLEGVISKDPKVHAFIKQSAEKVAGDLIVRLENQSDISFREGAIQWGQVVLSSLIRNAGGLFLDNPAAVFQTPDKVYQLVEASSTAILDLILGAQEDEINLKNLLSTNGLERILEASLSILAQNPEQWNKQEGLQGLIQGLSAAISKEGIQKPELLADLLPLVLEIIAKNIDDSWTTEEESVSFLLIENIHQLMLVLSKEREDGTWKPQFSYQQILVIAEQSLSYVIRYPALLLDKVKNNNSLFYYVFDTSIQTLGSLPESKRLRFSTFKLLIDQILQAVIRYPDLFNQADILDDETESLILEEAFDFVFHSVFPEQESSKGPINRPLISVLNVTLDKILAKYPPDIGIIIMNFLSSEAFPLDLRKTDNQFRAETLIDYLGQMIKYHPFLMEKDTHFELLEDALIDLIKPILKKHSELAIEIIAQILEYSTFKLNWFIHYEEEETGMKHVLIGAINKTLEAMLDDAYGVPWLDRYSYEQNKDLFSSLINFLIRKPKWIHEHNIGEVLHAIFIAIQIQPKEHPIPFDMIKVIIEQVLAELEKPKAWLRPFTLNEEESILPITYMLEWLLQILYSKPYLLRIQLIVEDILKAILSYLIKTNQNRGIAIESIDDTARRLMDQIAELEAGEIDISDFKYALK